MILQDYFLPSKEVNREHEERWRTKVEKINVN